jgi:hypothetical protein
VLGDHQDWLVVTLEPWLEEEELLFELLELELEPESLEVVLLESSEVVLLESSEVVLLESSEVESLDVPESLVVVVDDVVVAVSSEVAFACCDPLLDVVEPREPVAEIVPKAIANVARAAATTRRRMTRARCARARRRSRTRSEVEVGSCAMRAR